MSLENTNKMLKIARLKNYAIGAYNVFNYETVKAAVCACKEMNVPIIIQASESAVNYIGAKNLVDIVKNETQGVKTPISLHLDHGKSFEMIEKCIKAGFTSVMIDASTLPFEENVELTKKVVKFAHKHNVSVEAELGEIVGVEDNVSASTAHLTNPKKALEFINLTKVDSLAVSIGTAHGINKGTKTPIIHYDILNELQSILPKDFPLVCHGASSVEENIKSSFLASGGILTKAQGISVSDLKKMATSTPVCKINVDTDLRLVFCATMRDSLNKNPDVFDPRTHLKKVIEAVKNRIIYTSTQLFM